MFLLLFILILFILLIILYNKNQHRIKNETSLNSDMINNGKSFFKDKKVIITGLARDSEKSIGYAMTNVYQLVKHFKNYKIIIVENDSIDNTRKLLLDWNKSDPNIEILGCNDINLPECKLQLPRTIQHNGTFSRIEKMVYLRNIYIDHIKKYYPDYDYVIVYDFDLRCSISDNGFLTSGHFFKSDPSIDCLSSLGLFDAIYKTVYYDPYAHVDQLTKHLNHKVDKDKFIWYKYDMDNFINKNLIKVYSSFGGMSIYNLKSLINTKYCTYKMNNDNDDHICEHVCLHKNMNNIYINGNMILYIDFFNILNN